MFSKASLEMLDTVARLGSFTAAAEVLHKVPSAISYGVRQVEQDLDVVLFRRLPRKVELTPAGELFMAEGSLVTASDGRGESTNSSRCARLENNAETDVG